MSIVEHLRLPAYLTIDEAVHELTDRTGASWTPRSLLGYAARHEISVYATIDRDVRLVRAKPIEGEQNELLGPAGFVACLSADAVRSYLLTGIARFDGIEGTEMAEIFGPPALFWTMQWVFPEGEEAPVVRVDSFRVSGDGLLQLIEAYTTSQPAASGPPEKAAPVVTPAADSPTDDGKAVERLPDDELAELFDPVKVAALEAMFPDSGRWAGYAERAKRNGLSAAKAGRSLFNPYRAVVWWFNQGHHGWKWERCLRVLANNLPARSMDSKHLLTGEFD